MSRDLSLPDERAAVGIDVFERTFERDDISRARHVDLFYERGKRRRLSRARRSGNDDQTGGRVDELAEIRVQIAAVQILDGRCEQPYGGGHSAHGSIEIDPAAHAADGHGHVGGTAFPELRPTLGAQEFLGGLHEGVPRYGTAHRLQVAAHPCNERGARFQMQVAGAQRPRLFDPLVNYHGSISPTSRCE